MDGHFLFRGMLVQLTCSILELSLRPPCRRGKGLQSSVESKDDVIWMLWIRGFLFALAASTFRGKIWNGHRGSASVPSALLPCPASPRTVD